MIRVRIGTIAPIGLDHGLYQGCIGIIGRPALLQGRQAVRVTIQKGTPILLRHPQGVSTRQDGVTTVGGDTVNVHAPTPGQRGATPPGIVIGVHTQPPAGKPLVQVKIG